MKHSRLANLFGAVAIGLVASTLNAQATIDENKFLLIRNDQPIEDINLVQINENSLVAGDSSGGWRVVGLDICGDYVSLYLVGAAVNGIRAGEQIHGL